MKMIINTLKIRKATADDIQSVLTLYAQTDIDNGVILNLDEAKTIFKKFQHYPNYSLYIAELENQIVGTFELLIMDNLAHQGAPSGVVEDVVVAEGFKSKGIGKKMMEFAMEVCREHRCYKLTLSSNLHRERAHQFYEDLGFVKHGYSFLMKL